MQRAQSNIGFGRMYDWCFEFREDSIERRKTGHDRGAVGVACKEHGRGNEESKMEKGNGDQIDNRVIKAASQRGVRMSDGSRLETNGRGQDDGKRQNRPPKPVRAHGSFRRSGRETAATETSA
ncbi:hypothetical protein NUW58_g10269 [Xylaria curta]|uniref:Uncharacterized protein n=1 Tax=Xylaria curta TaxID=42375 RepID=A0ACC1MPR5_9PEZI|nr:hypothetical protein NUW58_g10269 [Xylaria curta]